MPLSIWTSRIYRTIILPVFTSVFQTDSFPLVLALHAHRLILLNHSRSSVINSHLHSRTLAGGTVHACSFLPPWSLYLSQFFCRASFLTAPYINLRLLRADAHLLPPFSPKTSKLSTGVAETATCATLWLSLLCLIVPFASDSVRNLFELLCIWNLSQGGTSKPVSFKLFSVLLDGVGFDPVQKHSGFFHHFLQLVRARPMWGSRRECVDVCSLGSHCSSTSCFGKFPVFDFLIALWNGA